MARPIRSGGAGEGRYYMVGDYVVEDRIGSGSFSTVWNGRHRTHGTEVAIKEIVTARLNSKLKESLKSEIFILQKIHHPNIVRLLDMIEESGNLYIILEYCKGGDLSEYIRQYQGKLPEATVKHFMQQLVTGLKILRENNIIHRDLKPQNLLLFTNDDKPVLKIADFGFARSLHRDLAETVCGSPLYMAPEIMQGQKYDAKADLWSVGAILFQLVTGKTPFTGGSQMQLLQNILNSTELQFPLDAKYLNPHCIDLCRKLLRHNPVERLTFEEFFNHPYLSQLQPNESFRNKQSQRLIDGSPVSGRSTVETAREDCLHFNRDDDNSSAGESPSSSRRSPMRSMYGFFLDKKVDRREVSTISNKLQPISKDNKAPHIPEITGFSLGGQQLSEENLNEIIKTNDRASVHNSSTVVDSLESIEHDYVIVSGPPMDSSSSVHASKTNYLPYKSSPPHNFGNTIPTPTAQVPISGAETGRGDFIGSLESHSSDPGISEGSMDVEDNLEQPSTDCMTRIKSLQCCASAISELVNEKMDKGKQLEAFSIQLVILAIWKQALDVCRTLVASTTEGSRTQETTKLRELSKVQHGPDVQECLDSARTRGPLDICSQIDRAFLLEVGNAEELSRVIEPGNTEMPDSMELIYQSALAFGRRGAVSTFYGAGVYG
ncbi:serine/threonine-protein kinase ATG1c-like isoform X2 [Olea europaea var. sylvestris]|uniref:serine/threonine-protein kinase ATG1c-like isoform X2 n=1 Tax=Olea europaea var. sylvestris TaxID=158386 RepID=UPI000C1D5BEF|nr:serine/threonine-protein kinase ATG1c-like isoform X2 [Olea europaea var. sylvestris]